MSFNLLLAGVCDGTHANVNMCANARDLDSLHLFNPVNALIYGGSLKLSL
jgi:hypothetical protein